MIKKFMKLKVKQLFRLKEINLIKQKIFALISKLLKFFKN